MVGFALSCFGLLLFLWLAFGGPIPFKPKGYQFKIPFREATQLAQEADVRISGVPVGKVKDIERRRTAADRGDDRARAEVRAAPQGRQGDPAPEDAAGRDLRRADAGHPATARRCPRAACSPSPGRADGRARRDLPHLRPADARRRSRSGCRTRRSRSSAAARTSPTRSATSRRSPTTPTSCWRSSTRSRARSSGWSRNTGVVFDALTERDGQLALADHELEPRLRDHGAAQRRAAADSSRSCRPSSAESQITLERLDQFAHNTNPLVTAAAPGGARALADADRARSSSRPTSWTCSATSAR